VLLAALGFGTAAAGAFEPWPVTVPPAQTELVIRSFVEQSGDGTCGTDAPGELPGGLSRASLEASLPSWFSPTTPPGQLEDALRLVEAYELTSLVEPLLAIDDTEQPTYVAAALLGAAGPLADARQRALVDARARALVERWTRDDLSAFGDAALTLCWKLGDPALLHLVEERARAHAVGDDVKARKLGDLVGKVHEVHGLLAQRAAVLGKPAGEQLPALVRLYSDWNQNRPELAEWAAHELRAQGRVDAPAVVAAFRVGLRASPDAVSRLRGTEGLRYFGGAPMSEERALEAAAKSSARQSVLHQLTWTWWAPPS
jgi:hypothetical protein